MLLQKQNLWSLLVLSSMLSLTGCEKGKTSQADVYAVFNYSGPKIDNTTTEKDRVIFRNVDGTAPVYVPAAPGDLCGNTVFIGTYALYDTLEWHLRLVDPDGDPANFKLYFNS